MIYTLSYLKEQANEIAAAWDGTTDGKPEEDRGYAEELLERITEIEELIKVLHL